LRKTRPAPIEPDTIREQVTAAKAKLAQLVQQRIELAEASLTDADAEQRYRAAMQEVSAAGAEVERPEEALTSIEAKAAQALREEQAKALAEQRKKVAAMLPQRVEAAQNFTEHLSALVRAYRKLVDLSARCFVGWPGGDAPYTGTMLGNLEIKQAVAGELYRLGHVEVVTGGFAIGRDAPSLPAPRAPGLGAPPETMAPLATLVETANELALALIEEKHDH
jgi:hypothetical protein